MRLLLDENISSRIAEDLRAQGHDALGLTEVAELRGRPDGAVFAWAVERDRSIATYDVDFVALLRERIATEAPATDVIIVSARRFPGGDHGHGALLRALAALLDAPDVAPSRGRLLWLAAAAAT